MHEAHQHRRLGGHVTLRADSEGTDTGRGRRGRLVLILLPDSEVLVDHSEAQLSEEARAARLVRVDRDELPVVAGVRPGSGSAARCVTRMALSPR